MNAKLDKPEPPWLRKRPKGGATSKPVPTKTIAVEAIAETVAVETETEPVIETKSFAVEKTVTIPETPKKEMPKPKKIAGRRPEYYHALIGLKTGDQIIFAKDKKITAYITDEQWGVNVSGTTYQGIVPAAKHAYALSGISQPKRVTGLREWETIHGVRLETLYNQLPKVL